MKGEKLKAAIRNSDLSLAEISVKSGIPKGTLSYLYKKDEVETHYLKKLVAAGIDLGESITGDTGERLSKLENDFAHLKEVVDLLKEQLSLQGKLLKPGK